MVATGAHTIAPQRIVLNPAGTRYLQVGLTASCWWSPRPGSPGTATRCSPASRATPVQRLASDVRASEWGDVLRQQGGQRALPLRLYCADKRNLAVAAVACIDCFRRL
jgi:hypothetical protein